MVARPVGENSGERVSCLSWIAISSKWSRSHFGGARVFWMHELRPRTASYILLSQGRPLPSSLPKRTTEAGTPATSGLIDPWMRLEALASEQHPDHLVMGAGFSEDALFCTGKQSWSNNGGPLVGTTSEGRSSQAETHACYPSQLCDMVEGTICIASHVAHIVVVTTLEVGQVMLAEYCILTF
ncbi:uncharacterized protein B0I36DRAFT_349004 [Microdochium trichocladiopsis]|uniref:Uncharacterized protein n=1 Tax=Microdochium trichocladiopsis TaxID=1682393 RepID=A0A9P8Y6I1_9PEZI|nr:uncharacterized protein B0I36DRAFT_349004 [Microdochium trichocladiopsis]KAH7030823.1 hypothetical protein B0I36DRAFT_349004 [Microdochium trichocladiopsis]